MMLCLKIDNSFSHFNQSPPLKTKELIKSVLTYKDASIEALINTEFMAIRVIKKYGAKKKVGETQAHAVARQKRNLGFRAANIKRLKAQEIVCLFEKNTFRTGLLEIVKKCLLKHKIKYKENDRRKRPEPYLILPWRNKPFKPRYYQKEQIDICVKEGRGVIEACCASGKTLTICYITKRLAVKSLFIIPSSGLSVQISSQFKIWFGSSKVELLTAIQIRKKTHLPALRFITIQAIAALSKTGDLHLITKGVDAIFLDECHHMGAKSYIDRLKEFDNIFYRFGFSASFLRNDSKVLEMWSFLSTVLHKYPARQGIKDGFLTPMIHVTHELNGIWNGNYKKEYDANYAGIELLTRILTIIENAQHGQQILILVKLKSKGGVLIRQFLMDHGIRTTFISGDDDKIQINKAIESFNEGRIKILIGSSVIGEGIDIKSSHLLLNCVGEKSPITVVQGAGRLVRLHERKKVGFYHDFDFIDTKYLTKHFMQRKKIITENFDPDEFIKVDS